MKPNRSLSRKNRRRLSEIRVANGFLGRLFPDAGFSSAEMEKALLFAKEEETLELVSPAGVVRKLIGWYQGEHSGVTCRVLDAASVSGGLLWMGAAVDRIIEEMGSGRPALLVVTGLRDSIRPTHRWGSRAERERQENLTHLEARVNRWACSTGTPVALLVS